ncbi:hypothetical protein F511_36435 [Dorcoceras hygrometricum]|uniref:Uncharacterized protein n=1 Tax=Dorcoceras hygrometricum TaxID=472368 RepID=A0A2Z7BB71_9LAMI|nr:hypothetical protein F511_36435 [Dorcoceras hygrometricum]
MQVFQIDQLVQVIRQLVEPHRSLMSQLCICRIESLPGDAPCSCTFGLDFLRMMFTVDVVVNSILSSTSRTPRASRYRASSLMTQPRALTKSAKPIPAYDYSCGVHAKSAEPTPAHDYEVTDTQLLGPSYKYPGTPKYILPRTFLPICDDRSP